MDAKPKPELRPVRYLFHLGVIGAACLLGFSGCRGKPDATAELAELKEAFPASETAPPAPETAPAETPEEQPPESAQSYVDRALTAVKNQEAGEGVILLQAAQQTTTLGADQRMTIQKSIRALTAELVDRASRGDAKAQADLKAIEKYLAER